MGRFVPEKFSAVESNEPPKNATSLTYKKAQMYIKSYSETPRNNPRT